MEHTCYNEPARTQAAAATTRTDDVDPRHRLFGVDPRRIGNTIMENSTKRQHDGLN